MMRMRMKIYGMLVNRVPQIREKYHSVRDGQTTAAQRAFAWLLLLWMNLEWLLGRRDFGMGNGQEPDAGRRLLAEGSESALSLREEPEAFARRLGEGDLISFDVFDTLLLRPFDLPQDLFYLVGERLGYLDFRRLRMEMEERARQLAWKERGNREITLEEIYRLAERETGIPAREAMEIELELELSCCRPNPYLLETVCHLEKLGKELIAVSDMYLPAEQIRKMLEKCGYTALSACYVSCEYGVSKSDGGLYDLVQKERGSGKTCIHVGDNPISDVQNARKAGWRAEPYQSVREGGRKYRAMDLSAVTGSIYRGLVNGHIHNGLRAYPPEYEFGFLYGGILVLGYCQFIHDYAQRRGLDKLLFLARDGDILSQAYQLIYPQEGEKWAYVPWSRLAGTRLAANYYRGDYFRRFLYHKVNQGFSIEQTFQTMELGDMLPDLSREEGICPEEQLTDRNADGIKEYLIRHWEQVWAHYQKESEEGKKYFSQVLAGCRRAAAVDIGWAGSGAAALRCMVEREWRLDCEITGLLAGTNTCHNAEPDMSEAQLYGGMLTAYLFSQEHNRDLWKRHNPSRGDNVTLERLLASPKASFRGFGKPQAREGENPQEARLIQEGILDYCRLYLSHPELAMPVGRGISGRDAAAPIFLWMENFRSRTEKEDCQCVLT